MASPGVVTRPFLVALALISIMSMSMASAAASPSTGVGRSVDIPVKVVLIGFDTVDESYLSWTGDSRNLPSSIVNVDLISGNATGVVFHPKYTISMAPGNFKQNLIEYLQSIAQEFNTTNPWFGQYQYDPENPDYAISVPMPVAYVVYDANSVEEWIWSHAQDLGGFPDNGWTIVLANLPELPSVTWKDIQAFKATNGELLPESKPHYYGTSSADIDLGYEARFRDYMNAWGGHHRMWFADVSAGPVFNSEWTDLPLQVVLGDNDININTDFGKTWLTEYIGDYIWEATYNFVAPNFVYYPQYASKYEIDVHVFDDRTQAEKQAVPIQSTVNKDAMLAAWQELVPYSTVTVNLNIKDTPTQLHDVIRSSYKYTDSWIMGSVFAQPERYGVVDLKPVYKYVIDNFATLAPNARPAHSESYGIFDSKLVDGTMTIPVFAFAFSEETYFTYPYKWFIGDTDYEKGALLGIALPEAAFVSFNQWTFTRGDYVEPPQQHKGMGFTQTIIHEVGHEFGLMHPHQYSEIGDFIVSPMGYFTEDYKFGLIDKDAIQRAHADQLYIATLRLLGESSLTDLLNPARGKLAEADSAYSKMDYSGAVQTLLSAHQIAEQQSPTPIPPMVYLIMGVVVGLIVGVTAMIFLKRNKKSQ